MGCGTFRSSSQPLASPQPVAFSTDCPGSVSPATASARVLLSLMFAPGPLAVLMVSIHRDFALIQSSTPGRHQALAQACRHAGHELTVSACSATTLGLHRPLLEAAGLYSVSSIPRWWVRVVGLSRFWLMRQWCCCTGAILGSIKAVRSHLRCFGHCCSDMQTRGLHGDGCSMSTGAVLVTR